MDAIVHDADAPYAADHVPKASSPLSRICWPRQHLGVGLEELARRVRLKQPGIAPAWPVCNDSADLGPWLDWAGSRIGCELEAVDFPAASFARDIAGAGPTIVALHDGLEPMFLLMTGGSRGTLRCLGPDLAIHRCPTAVIAAVARARLEAPVEREIGALLDAAAIAPENRDRVRATMLDERLAGERIAGCWLLRPPPSASFWFQLCHAGLPRRFFAIVALLVGLFSVEIGGWAVIGDAALGGRLDLAWLIAWLLLVVSNVPLTLSMRWLNALFSLDLGRILKHRLLLGALRMDFDAVRHQGVGQLLGRVMEAQALEGLVLNGGLAVVIAAVELMFAAWILSSGAGGSLHVLLLTAWLVATALLCWRYFRRLRDWSATRMAMTHDLIERMVGHRTRLAQEWPDRRDAEDDQAIVNYLTVSRDIDHSVLPLGASASGGWKIAGILGLAPAFVMGAATPTSIAIAFGGILLANRAFTGIANGIASLAQAGVAWRLVAELFHAGSGTEPPATMPPDALRTEAPRLIDASELVFRYRKERDAILRGLDLSVRHGERVLLEGESGGGKSTLAALLTGLRVPDSGLLLMNGLDRRTLGSEWHRFATEAPQFHENHILSGPLAFNLLMGRGWPASAEDLREAREVCLELGLGPLLERMPAGIMQQIGETGWQLSHGERGRVFLARALLQNASLTILDESFAALDPETLKRCMDCAFRRAKTLIVIAHP